MAKPFWLVVSGHMLADWGGDKVSILVPKVDGHSYAVGHQGANGQVVTKLPNKHNWELKGLPEGAGNVPSALSHFFVTNHVSKVPNTAETHATILPFRRPDTIDIVAGRIVPEGFLNGMPASTVQVQRAPYSLVDTDVWIYNAPVDEPPQLIADQVSFPAFELDEAYVLILIAAQVGRPHGHGKSDGANKLLKHGGKDTTYRFMETVRNEKVFKNWGRYAGTIEDLIMKKAERGGPMGSCDRGNTGP